jgi:hypothetical protein
VSYTCNHTVCGLLHLASFSQRDMNGTSEGAMGHLWIWEVVTSLKHLYLPSKWTLRFPALVILHLT